VETGQVMKKGYKLEVGKSKLAFTGKKMFSFNQKSEVPPKN
jgi:hypothetical protein